MSEVDSSYWGGWHPHPLAPNETDVAIYERLLTGSATRLLLGNTRALMPLCTSALDLEPFLDDERVRQGDWNQNTEHFDAIFGDGVLNFTEELAHSVLKMATSHSKTFVARAFNHRLPIMRVADYFGKPADFSPQPCEVIDFEDYSFMVWKF